MWILLGNKTKASRVAGGRSIDRYCTTCGTMRTYVECDVKDSISAFFVTVFEGTQRRLVCLDCGDDVGLEPAATRTSSAGAESPRSRTQPRPPVSETEKDAMLAALKKKMGL